MKSIFILLQSILIAVGIPKANAAPHFLELKGSLSGTITDIRSGKPLEGTTIYIADLKAGTTTNAKGEFTINSLSEGLHLVEISHIGYSTIADRINITGNVVRNYQLDESIIENNAVVVTGVSRATQLKKMPFQVSVLKKEDLLQSASTGIIDAISRKPGVYNLSTGPAISKPLIRGLSYNRVLTINDGVRQEGQQWGDEHGIEIDEASVNKIEILKGPASLIYGSDAMAGVINIITNVPVQNNSLSFNAGTNVQTNNRLFSLNGNFAGNINGINWNVYSSKKEAGDYQNKYDGPVFNSRYNEHNFGGYAGYNGGWGFSHLLFSSYDLNAGLVEGERDSIGFFVRPITGGIVRVSEEELASKDLFIPFQNIRHNKVALDNSFKINTARLLVNLALQRNRRKEFGNADEPGETSLFFDLKTFTYSSALQFADRNGYKTTIGVNGMQQNNLNKGVEQLIPDYSLFDFGTYVFTEKEFKYLKLSGGIRYDNRNINSMAMTDAGVFKTPAFKKKYDNFSASLGLTAPVKKSINLKFNIARAFRAPGISELASNGAHEGTLRYEYGDVTLKNETSLQTDAGIDYDHKHFSVSIAGYYNNFSNFIFYRKLEASAGGDSIINVNGQDLTAFKFGQRKATLSGMEITLDVHPHPLDWLHIQNSFSFVSGKLKEAVDGSGYLPFIPAAKLLTEIRADLKKPSAYFKNVYAKFELDNTFSQRHPFTAYATESVTPAYSLLNAGIGADVINKKGKILFTINLAATNLTDKSYQNHLSRLKYAPVNPASGRTGVFGMGRNFSIKLNVPLIIKLKNKENIS